jgi:sulfoquinovosidase
MFTLALAALAASCSAAPAADAQSVDAGSLSASVAVDPWRLSFSSPTGASVLAEAPGTGAGPVGALGFRDGSGWRRATRVLSSQQQGAVWTAEVETTDPGGRRLAVRLAPDGEGVIALTAEVVNGSTAGVTQTGISFLAAPGERYLGFGERANAVDQRGNVVQNYVSDGPYTSADRPLLQSFVPPAGWSPRDDATYFPMPWLLSTAGYGVLVDNTEESRHRLGTDTPGAWSVEVDAPRIALRVFAGPRPADVLRRLTERVGRQPKPPAPWVFGAWFHTGQENQPPPAREHAAALTQRNADVPVSAVETHLRYLPCGSAVGNREAERERTAFFHSLGLATLSYFNPEICADYQPVHGDAVARDVLTENQLGQPYLYDAYVGDRNPPLTPISQIDFSAPGADAFFAELLSEAIADGHDGWMEDFGEYTPLDSVSANGMLGTQMHNLYPVLYHRSGYEFARSQDRPVARHIRSGWTGVHPYAQIVWGGDPVTDWGYDGLASAVRQALTMGVSGISTWGSDIGGFFTIFSPALSPELLTRWVQFGAVSGVMRTKFSGVGGGTQRVQVFDPGQIDNWRRYAKFRTQLYPYIAAADATYRSTGMPIMRHLSLLWPGDPRAAASEDTFMFGPDLLAAPVLGPGQRQRELYVPGGRWIDFWRAVAYKPGSGDLRLRRARVLRGGRTAVLPAPLERLPLLVRAGTLLPLLPASTDTLADRYDNPSLRSLAEQRRRLDLLAFPRGRSRATFLEGEMLVSRERRGGVWKLAIRGERKRRWRIEASLATLRRPFVPRCVLVGGKRLSKRRWSYGERKRRIAIGLKARRAILTVRSNCR